MARYVGNRKNAWLPCIINEEMDDMSEEEIVAVMRSTYWADNITNSEWPALLGHEGASRSARSKLKKKAIGWMMALGRIAYLDPKFYNTIVKEAMDLYAEQIKMPHPMFRPDESEEIRSGTEGS